ncbi:uncharacterized protein Z518_00370 [Rhinocladiella mackenziei CBS 650.93]|uniref:Uncharacterized protein n=1 Tax=Rhinocladiella mackenziei CBS 650.93 TaxID=1442369 RepID=A0A0D2J0S2_9EURO|nr:uncharacterized protein Z518_00370 [Rhinocladiella mackenziei CBS 650.93]KIX09291.1 hypothetical protein Z518_00370 [Rhinocladiella mackenziei CBS 650.93]
MEKRANIYSSRPEIVIMGDMFNWTVNNQHSVVGSQAIRTYRDIQAAESKILRIMSFISKACSVASIFGWGRRIVRKNDYVAKQALEVMANAVDVIIPGPYWMESLPFLTKLPKWLYPLPRAIQDQASLLSRYFYALSLEGSEGKEGSFSMRLIEEQNSNGLSNEEVASLTSNLIGGRR